MRRSLMTDEKKYDVYNYLDDVTKQMGALSNVYDFSKYAFRGEPQIFETPGMPGIFRGNDYDELIRNPMFERNLLNEMKSNSLTNYSDDLLMATDAQHDGFPSRLLDISYNCLIGLFFAVTPHYSKDIGCFDDSDGQVIIYGIDSLYSAHDEGVMKEYSKNLGVNKPGGIKLYNHKFLDHIRGNERIIAQNGGFVLFNGLEFNPIPNWQQASIKIPADSKQSLRKQLSEYFDIEMGTIYPEPANKVKSILEKSKIIYTSNIENDRTKAKLEIEKELQFYKEMLYSVSKWANTQLIQGGIYLE